ncbi:DUF1015 domain-containing protein [Acetonema longum]|uniref:SpoOJ/ParA/ParB/repB family protein n=1 Tax=Acetonema longum DSM 6540 TaxID=1009370 RepID=F7NG37_9FIRM|nr:DUF1015 family protein [Acetonema longum]EGO64955.1 hypothetical protein ALO_05118 [Acetonema longum DSM 6540]
MAVVKPFCGLRPAPELASRVASLPYDVMDSDEARALVKTNPYSFLRVTKSEVDLPPEIDIHSPRVYEKAKDNLAEFIAQGILRQDSEPCFYVYKQKMGHHVQIGLVAAVSAEEYEHNIIRKHELTRPDKEQDRVDHIRATGAQTGPVFLTYKATDTVSGLIDQAMAEPPAYDFMTEDGISHTLYLVADRALCSRIEAAFQQVDVLYIADGHHRSAAAARVRESLRKSNPGHNGQEEYNRFLAVIFPHDMMQIMDYNRAVTDLAGRSPEGFLTEISRKFIVELKAGGGAYKPSAAHTLGMYLGGCWYKLTAKPNSFDPDDPVGALDVSILQRNLLAPLLAIKDPRTDKRIHFVGGIRGMKELERLVDSGRYAVAFSLYPTSIQELMAIADAGEIMPPKSTWFEPKLRDAMVIHLI